MKRLLLGAAVTAAVLAVPTAAWAKGPTQATITGPGVTNPVVIHGQGEPGSGTTLGSLTDETGLFPAVFEEQPSPMLRHRPPGPLGARYTVRYVLPGGYGRDGVVTQFIYPYARAGTVTYTDPDQPFLRDQGAAGGWFMALPGLRESLTRLGVLHRARQSLSATASPSPATTKSAVGSDGSWRIPKTASVAAAVVGLSLFTVVALHLRRQRRGRRRTGDPRTGRTQTT